MIATERSSPVEAKLLIRHVDCGPRRELTAQDWDRLGPSLQTVVVIMGGREWLRQSFTVRFDWDGWERVQMSLRATAHKLRQRLQIAHLFENGALFE